MNFSAISDKSIVGKVLRSPLKLIPTQAPLPILQGRLRGKLWVAGSSSHGCWLGSYEYEKRRIFEKLVKPSDVVYDIGAHVGFYSLLASTIVGPVGTVVAIEPWPANLKYLKRHLTLNKVQNVTVIEGAASEQAGEALFEPGLNSSMGRLSKSGEARIRTVTLDSLLRQHQISHPDVMKIDVEGAELEVLIGGRECIKQARPLIFLATHGELVHSECCEFLIQLGYRLRALGGESVQTTTELVAYPN